MKLTLTKNNSPYLQLDLDPAKEYFLGRSPQSDIVLSDPEVSRKHARLFYKDNIWTCEVVSSNGFITVSGNSLTTLSLAGGSRFSIGSFEFHYEEKSDATKTFAVTSEPAIQDFDEDKTNFAPIPIKFALFREDAQGEPIEEITLHDGPITAGRSDECEIMLRDSKASRKHFVLEKTSEGYSIKDLSSSYGTLVNGQKIDMHSLKSGERIQIGEEVFLYQEIHSAFENLPALAEPNNTPPTPYAHYEQAVIKVGGEKRKIKPLYYALGLLVIAGVVNQFTNDKKDQPQQRQISSIDGQQNKDPFSKLNDNQKKFIEETYNLSLSLYTSGKYDLAALEISKIFQLVPNYKDAKNIEALCQQALELKKQKDETDRLAREQGELNERVAGILSECEQLFNAKKYAQVESCVSQIIETDPENAKAKWLTENAMLRLDAIKDSKEAREAALRRYQKAKITFEQAKRALNEKRFPAAVRDFSSVKNMSFNDPENIKAKAQEGIKFAKEQMLKASSSYVREGKAALEQKEYKAAITKLNKALELFKENSEARDLKEKAMAELRIEMKNLYSESVIEEDLGNIESAKKKWRLILETNVSSDPYFEKAKNKINKYEK